ncbi:MAG: hypothetical protein Kow00120_14060 [Anaerolineae bacterium]
MDEIRVGYFVEDIGHQSFLEALVNRVGAEVGLSIPLDHQWLSAAGGYGKASSKLREFLRGVQRGQEPVFHLLIVAKDANCHGYTEVKNGVKQHVDGYGYPAPVAYAVPDPHIERWYMADLQVLQSIAGRSVPLPAYKCERARYKALLKQAFPDVPLGGLEYGGDIAAQMDLYRAGNADPALRHFVDEVKAALVSMKRDV